VAHEARRDGRYEPGQDKTELQHVKPPAGRDSFLHNAGQDHTSARPRSSWALVRSHPRAWRRPFGSARFPIPRASMRPSTSGLGKRRLFSLGAVIFNRRGKRRVPIVPISPESNRALGSSRPARPLRSRARDLSAHIGLFPGGPARPVPPPTSRCDLPDRTADAALQPMPESSRAVLQHILATSQPRLTCRATSPWAPRTVCRERFASQNGRRAPEITGSGLWRRPFEAMSNIIH